MGAPFLTAEPLSRIGSTQVRWLWEPYLPRGKLSLLDGDPGVGRSFLTLDLAARLSRGGYLPDGKASESPVTTLLLSGEDSASDTIKPRAEAAGADLERLLVVASTDSALLRFPADLGELQRLIRVHEAGLVVIDPLMAFLPPEVAANADQCVRQALAPLARLAEQTDCTVLLVRHLRKKGAAKAVYRGLGSIGIIGAVRTGLYAGVHPSIPALRVLAVTKTNFTRIPPALGYRLVGDEPARSAIEWTGTVDISADGLGLPGPAVLQPRDKACQWLLAELANGPRKAAELFAGAAELGIPDVTLKRAKDEIHARSHQVHFKNGERCWYWYDTTAAWPASAPFKKPFELAPLDPLE